MRTYYHYYIHWPQLWFSVFFLVIGLVPLVDIWRTQVTPLERFSTGAFDGFRETQMLKETTVNTVTIKDGRVIGVNSQNIAPDSLASEKITSGLRSSMLRRSPSWFGVETWVGRTVEWLLAIFFLMSGVAGLRQVYRARFAADFKEWSDDNEAEISVFIIEEQRIRLRRPYPFSASLLAGRTHISPHELTGIGKYGSEAVLEGREIIFFPQSQRGDLKAFAQRHSIPVVIGFDAWRELLRPLNRTLDEPLDEEDWEHNRLMLRWLGIGAGEAWRIRWALRCWRFFQPWHWPGYDEDNTIFDHPTVLCMTGATLMPRRRWYWRTMQLALRNLSQCIAMESNTSGA